MSLNRIFTIVLRQLYLIRGSFSRVFPLFIWAVVDMLLWGFLTSYLNKVSSSGFDFIPALMGAVLFWDFFIRIMQGVTMAFFEDVWSRNFLNIFSTPLLVGEYVCGLVASSIVTSLIGLAAMVLIAVAAFKLPLTVYGMMAIPFILILFIFGIALGIFGSALVLRFGPASEWFVWPIPAIISPFVGVMYPVSTLPEWMQHISRLLPPTYIFESLRSIVAGSPVSPAGLVPSALLSVACLFMAYRFFLRVYVQALRTGLIARYSAESIS